MVVRSKDPCTRSTASRICPQFVLMAFLHHVALFSGVVGTPQRASFVSFIPPTICSFRANRDLTPSLQTSHRSPSFKRVGHGTNQYGLAPFLPPISRQTAAETLIWMLSKWKGTIRQTAWRVNKAGVLFST
ncbi:hypothetical protein B0H14DRAFT_2604643 [Mycena olivaceomarginata]|nr:hypothetical protein B0H14DRAFT_2604643 [Mycena olivaceomarginata]